MANKQEMTYRVRNTSLDQIFGRMNIANAEELIGLPDDTLLDILKEVKSQPFFEATKKTRASDESYMGAAGPKYKFVAHTSVERLIAENTIEIFMPIDYWRSEHKAIAKERDVFKRLDAASTGKETMDIMKSIKVGFTLKPGEETEVAWTDDFVEERIKNSPYLKKISVEKIGGGVVERETPVDEGKSVGEGIDIKDMDYRTLQDMAKEKGLRYTGVPKSELIKQLIHG